jgi:hypothetical protein
MFGVFEEVSNGMRVTETCFSCDQESTAVTVGVHFGEGSLDLYS